MKKRNYIWVLWIFAIIALVYCWKPIEKETVSENFVEDTVKEETSNEKELDKLEGAKEAEKLKEEQIVITTEEIDYPKPEYPFAVEELTIEMQNLSREYCLAWVSDLHMITDCEPTEEVKEEFIDTINERHETLSKTPDGVYGEELWPEIVKFLNYGEFDGVILGGDLMDYCSVSNMKCFTEEYRKIVAPVLYIRADHDYGFWYGGEVFTEPKTHEVHKEIDGDNLEEKYLDFGDFLVVGVNSSTKDMPAEQYKIIEGLYQSGKPIIAVTHVPYASKVDSSLEELSMKVRNKIYYWGGGHYEPNDVTSKYLDLIYSEDTPVKQVLAGHMHAKWDGMLTEQVPQHIFSPAFSGTIGVVHILPKK